MENLDQSNNKNVSLSLISEYGASDSDSDDTETQSNTGNEDSDAAELSEMVLKNNIINACAHGPLSRPSDREESVSTRHMIIDSCESGVVEYEVTEYRDVDSDSDTSDSSESDVDSVKDVDEISSGDEGTVSRSEKPEQPRVQGELGLDDLPPIEDLAISLPEQETHKIGTIVSIVDRLVIVRAFPETPAVDLDSVLFLDNGAKALGKVFDVFGPVTEPHYCVRFNSGSHARARGAAEGAAVSIAPRTPHTSYVFLKELMKVKGSDASWLHDVEPPPHQVEYSDDEEERKANRLRREQRREDAGAGHAPGTPAGQPLPAGPPPPAGEGARRRGARPAAGSSRFGRNPFAGRRAGAPPPRGPPARGPRAWGAEPRLGPERAWAEPRGPFPGFAPLFPGAFPPPPPFLFGAGPGPLRRALPVFGGFCGPAPPRWGDDAPPPPPGT